MRTSRPAHRSAKGQVVMPGQQVGIVGQTGDATACHLHFELWVGKWYRGGIRSTRMPLPADLRRLLGVRVSLASIARAVVRLSRTRERSRHVAAFSSKRLTPQSGGRGSALRAAKPVDRGVDTAEVCC